MKKIITNIFQFFNKTYDWLNRKTRYDIKYGGMIFAATFLGGGAIIYLNDNPIVIKIVACTFGFMFLALYSIFRFDVTSKTIMVLTKNNYTTPRQLMKNLNHMSYIYGLLWFSIETSMIFEMCATLITRILFGKARIVDFITVWIISMFMYTFFYFGYHIYFAYSKEKLEHVKHQLQLYLAIGSTISFVMTLFGENHIFKILVVGTMLEYTWLQYMITNELMEFS